MPSYILYHEPTDLYLEYSTVCDAPTTYAVPHDQMRQYLIERDGHGGDGGRAVDERLGRARSKGCSSRDPSEDLSSAITCNRAGLEETEMSFDQFVRYYFTERRGVLLPDDCRPVGEVKCEDDED